MCIGFGKKPRAGVQANIKLCGNDTLHVEILTIILTVNDTIRA